MINWSEIEEAHRLLVHPNGGVCPDGCDDGAKFCKCCNGKGSGQGTHIRHRSGHLVCARCSRVIHEG